MKDRTVVKLLQNGNLRTSQLMALSGLLYEDVKRPLDYALKSGWVTRIVSIPVTWSLTERGWARVEADSE